MNYSKQRVAIKDFLMTRKDHPTAEVIYYGVRETIPNISLGTVYRNLAQLHEQGEILKLHLEDGFDHFDADTKPHNHFLCQKCGAVMDLTFHSDQEQSIDQLANQEFDGQITGHFIYFQGICSNCSE